MCGVLLLTYCFSIIYSGCTLWLCNKLPYLFGTENWKIVLPPKHHAIGKKQKWTKWSTALSCLPKKMPALRKPMNVWPPKTNSYSPAIKNSNVKFWICKAALNQQPPIVRSTVNPVPMDPPYPNVLCRRNNWNHSRQYVQPTEIQTAQQQLYGE